MKLKLQVIYLFEKPIKRTRLLQALVELGISISLWNGMAETMYNHQLVCFGMQDDSNGVCFLFPKSKLSGTKPVLPGVCFFFHIPWCLGFFLLLIFWISLDPTLEDMCSTSHRSKHT